MAGFVDKLHAAARRNGSLLCVGLDPDPGLMPVEDAAAFNRAVIEATSDLVCAYKPNLGFFEALGRPGLDALERTLDCIREKAPDAVVIGDAKRGDVHRFYAKAMFETWGFDAATVHPYAGRDTIEHFLAYPDRGVFVLCRTSNPGARDFQDLAVTPPYGGDTMPLYEWVAMQALAWNDAGNVGLVVGATYPDELRRVRELCPTLPILLPGVGAQHGALGSVAGERRGRARREPHRQRVAERPVRVVGPRRLRRRGAPGGVGPARPDTRRAGGAGPDGSARLARCGNRWSSGWDRWSR